MMRATIIKDFLFKSVLPILVVVALYYIFKPACMKDDAIDYAMLWICCGLPFGWHSISLARIPDGTMGGGIAMFALRFVLAGAVGGLVLVWRLVVAVAYVPITLFHIIKM